jgi:hypothetical protein
MLALLLELDPRARLLIPAAKSEVQQREIVESVQREWKESTHVTAVHIEEAHVARVIVLVGHLLRARVCHEACKP